MLKLLIKLISFFIVLITLNLINQLIYLKIAYLIKILFIILKIYKLETKVNFYQSLIFNIYFDF